ncbi:MAG: MotA/TolQ/ExbB proton channel family protein [Candidatus Algichlamydia australiensis]|nr:MotA/TolQ/ExbB proton channel family protein [Chlamydiales bacterium]
MNSLHLIMSAYRESDGFGKLIFFSLFGLSVLSWAVLIHKALVLRKVEQGREGARQRIITQKERLLDITLGAMGPELPSPFVAIFHSLKSKTKEVLEKNHFFKKGEDDPVYLSRSDMELIEGSVQNSLAAETKQLEKNLFILSTIVTVAPFLGLLGTVWGILLTFAGLQQGSSFASSQLIMGGLSTALATTVLGLVIAIPALIGYNYLKNRIRELHGEMEEFGAELVGTVELQYRKVE